MKGLARWIVAAVAVFGICASLVEPVEASRRDGLENSELIEDKDDVFTYPQLAVDYTNLLSFEYGIDSQTGNGLALFGNDTYGIGVAVHRGDLFEMRGLNAPASQSAIGSVITDPNANALRPTMFDLHPARSYPYVSPDLRAIASAQTPLSAQGQSFEATHNVFDIIGGFDTGNGKLGGRLSFGIGGARSNPQGEDKTDEGQTYVQLKGGYSGSFGSTSVDTALTLLFNRADSNDVDPNSGSFGDNIQKARVLGAGFDGRLYHEYTETTSLGALFDFGISNFSVTDDSVEDNPPKATLTNVSVQAGAGPVFTIGGDDEDEGPEMSAMLAQFGSSEPSEDTEESTGTEETPSEDDDDEETATDATKPETPSKPAASPEGGADPSKTPGDETEESTSEEAKASEAAEEVEETATRKTTQKKETADAQSGEERDEEPTTKAAASNRTGEPDPARRLRRRSRRSDPKSSFEQSAEIAAYGVFGFTSISGDPNDEESDDSFGATGLLAPGIHLSGEFHVLKWLYFRSGAQYYFFHYGARQSVEEGEHKAGGDIANFSWSAGMGVEVGDFRFDGAFQPGFLQAGPYFLGGAGGGMFATASAQYRW